MRYFQESLTINRRLGEKAAMARTLNEIQVFDNGTNVGIGNVAPGARLDVSGTGIFRGALTLPATGQPLPALVRGLNLST
jgi:hypothetical protein